MEQLHKTIENISGDYYKNSKETFVKNGGKEENYLAFRMLTSYFKKGDFESFKEQANALKNSPRIEHWMCSFVVDNLEGRNNASKEMIQWIENFIYEL